MEPARSGNDIARMMQDYAEQAVRLARQLHIELDYSEASLQQVDGLLDRWHKQRQAGQYDAALDGQTQENSVDEMSRIWGGYLGEVVRRRFGGEWTIENYPAGDFPIVALNVNGARLFPAMKIHKRLTNGAVDNLLPFYQNVRARLGARPGAKLQ